MIAVLYSPAEDQIYEWDGWMLKTRIYSDVGGYTDETGAKYYLGSTACYGSYRDYGLVKLGQLED